MDLRNRTISKYEVEALFRDVLNQTQIEQIANFLKLLGLYVFVDREQLDIFAERHFGRKIGLSYIQKAVQYNLVAEIQTEENLDKYYFQLKMGGFLFLNEIDFRYRKLPLDAARTERAKVLAINNYLIDKNHLLTNQHGLGLFEPLFAVDGTILFQEMSQEELDKLIPGESSFTFEKIEITEVNFYDKAKGNIQSMII